jgi:hypothetical protein
LTRLTAGARDQHHPRTAPAAHRAGGRARRPDPAASPGRRSAGGGPGRSAAGDRGTPPEHGAADGRTPCLHGRREAHPAGAAVARFRGGRGDASCMPSKVRPSPWSSCTPARCSTTTSSTRRRDAEVVPASTMPSPRGTAASTGVVSPRPTVAPSRSCSGTSRSSTPTRCSSSGQVPDQVLLAAFRRFTVLREEVMVGQALDLHAATAPDDRPGVVAADRDAQVGQVLGGTAAGARGAARGGGSAS